MLLSAEARLSDVPPRAMGWKPGTQGLPRGICWLAVLLSIQWAGGTATHDSVSFVISLPHARIGGAVS